MWTDDEQTIYPAASPESRQEGHAGEGGERFATRPLRAGRARARLQENADPAEYAWTVAEAAATLGRSVDSVRRYIRQGELPAGHVEGTRPGEYRLRPTDVNALRDHLNDVIEVDGDDQDGSLGQEWPAVADDDSARMHVSTSARMHGGDNDPNSRALAVLDNLYQGQMVAKDSALVAKDDLIAELRRRAEIAEHLLADRDTLSQQILILQEKRAADRERMARETARLHELRLADRRQMAEELERLDNLRRAEMAELAALRAQAAIQKQHDDQEAITKKYQEAVKEPSPQGAAPEAAAPVEQAPPHRPKWAFWK